MGQAAFGAAGGFVTTAVLVILTIFVMIAYMVLVRDIWSGLAEAVLSRNLDPQECNQVIWYNKLDDLTDPLTCLLHGVEVLAAHVSCVRGEKASGFAERFPRSADWAV